MSEIPNTPEQIRAVLKQELQNIAPEADLEALDPAVDIREELDIDSFDFVRYISMVCTALGVDIPEPDYIEFSALARAEGYLLRQLENRG